MGGLVLLGDANLAGPRYRHLRSMCSAGKVPKVDMSRNQDPTSLLSLEAIVQGRGGDAGLRSLFRWAI